MMCVHTLHQCATVHLNYMILVHMQFLDQVVISSFFRTTLLPHYYYYYYYYYQHHHARFGTRAADRYVSNCSMGSSCFSELNYDRHAVKCTLHQILCVCVCEFKNDFRGINRAAYFTSRMYSYYDKQLPVYL